MFTRPLLVLALSCAWSAPVRAQPSSQTQPQTQPSSQPQTSEDPGATPAEIAAREFELGVEHFENAKYAAAARAFLRADMAAPASDTISNALTAAERSGDHLLVMETARRALSREGTDPGLSSAAREAITRAAQHLSVVRLTCAPTPCEIFWDGEATAPSEVTVTPGTHRVAARFPGGEERAFDTGVLQAGTHYAFEVEPAPPQDQKHHHEPTSGSPPSESSGGAEPEHKRSPAWLDEAVLIAGGAVTLGLAGALTWSGVETINTRSETGDTASRSEVSQIESDIRRSNALLGATLGMATLTGVWALMGVDYQLRPPVTASLAPGIYALRVEGTF